MTGDEARDGARTSSDATARSGVDEQARRALAEAGLVFSVTAPLTYLATRLLERARAPVVDPGQILASTHLAFVWRSLLGVWFGAAVAWLAYLRRRDEPAPAGRAKSLALGAIVVGIALAVAAVRLP